MRSARRIWVTTTVLAMALVGCSGGGDSDGSEPSPTSSSEPEKTGSPEGEGPDSGEKPWGDGGRPAAAKEQIGGADSDCDLPVSFSTARDWTAEEVRVDHSQGGLELVCEVDAKPAGNLGYIRVWTQDTKKSPRAALASFVKDQKTQQEKYRSVKSGSTPLVEASFRKILTVDGEVLERKPELAFAVETDDAGVAVVSLGGLDAQEHEEMIPAYLLAKETVKVRGG